MRKKDYELIEWILRKRYESQTGERKDEVRAVIVLLAYELAINDPKFSQEKFWQGCGIETERKLYKGTRFESD